jgi:hypothetical protein
VWFECHRIYAQQQQQQQHQYQFQKPLPHSAVNSQQSRYVRTAQVHISYLSKQLNLIVNEEFLRDIFSNFGDVLEVSLKKACMDPVSVFRFHVLLCPCFC